MTRTGLTDKTSVRARSVPSVEVPVPISNIVKLPFPSISIMFIIMYDANGRHVIPVDNLSIVCTTES